MNSQPTDLLVLEHYVSTGAAGFDATPDGALARALRTLIELGRLIHSTAVCYFAAASGAPLYWLGVFVETVARRILFFPDLRARRSVRSRTGAGPVSRREFAGDHMSLEAHRRRWHFTQHEEPRDHICAGVTHTVDGCVLWAGMTIARRYLREVRQQTRISAAVPGSDVDRRSAARADVSVSRQIRVIVVMRNAFGSDTLSWSVRRQRTYVSCTASSASALDPSMR